MRISPKISTIRFFLSIKVATGLSVEKSFTSNFSGEDLTLENLAFNMNVFSFKCRFTVLLKNEAYCARTEKVYSIKMEKCFIAFRFNKKNCYNGTIFLLNFEILHLVFFRNKKTTS